MFNSVLKRAAHSIGCEILYFVPQNSIDAATKAMFANLGIDLVFDVGANVGQYGEKLFRNGFQGRVVSFEPLSEAHAKLTSRARHFPSWTVHPRSAIGASPDQITIHISENSVSSSILPMLKRHSDACPDSTYTSSETVTVVRLDDVAQQYIDRASSMLLKVDTQGFEWKVLDGAPELLSKVTAVQLEVSLVPLYEGEPLWLDVIRRMENLGFILFFVFPAFSDSITGQTLQLDAMFVRTKSLASASANARP